MSGLGEFSKKYENVLRINCAANEYLQNIKDLEFIDKITIPSQLYPFALDNKENVYESYMNVIKYCNLVVQTYPAILNMDYSFDENSKEATIKHLQNFQALIYLKTIISNCHHHLLVIPASIMILKQKLKEFVDKNLASKKKKSKEDIYTLMIEEEKNRLLTGGILRDKNFIKLSTKAYKLVSKLSKKDKLFLKNTKNVDVELVKKYISNSEIKKVVDTKNQAEFNKIYIHALGTLKVDEKPADYEKRWNNYEKQIVDQFNKETGVNKIEDCLVDMFYYGMVMQTCIDELYYDLVLNNFLSNFSVPHKIRSEEQVQYLISYLKENRARSLEEAIEIYKKEVAYPYEIVINEEEFAQEMKKREEFLKTLQKNKQQDFYVEAINFVNQYNTFVEQEKNKLIASVNNQLNKIGVLSYVKGISKLIPHKDLVSIK